MLPLDVAPQGSWCVKTAIAPISIAYIGRHAEMGGSDVALQGLVLAEALATAVVAPAAEQIGTPVDSGMATQSCGSDKGFAAARLFASVSLLVGVGAFYVLGKVLLLKVIFAAVFVWTAEGTIICVRPKVSVQAGWAVERLGTAGVGALYRLEVGRELARSTRSCGDGGGWRCLRWM